jgi:hypothetical protein
VNNGDTDVSMDLQAGNSEEYIGALTGQKVIVNGGRIQVKVYANSGEIWIPAEMFDKSIAPVKTVKIEKTPEPVKEEEPKKVEELKQAEEPKPVKLKAESPKAEAAVVDWSKSYEDMTVEELQEAILEKMRKNGPVTDYMLGTVKDNTHHGSLVNWVKSFR